MNVPFAMSAKALESRSSAHTDSANQGAAMLDKQTFRIKDYELTCSARATDNGRFEPALVVSKHIWPSRPRTIAVRRGAHPTAEVAIESARAQGVEWVTNFG